MGSILGSFIATIVIRWPLQESVLRGRSRCDHCSAILAARDLVPLVSVAINRGKCRGCGGQINPVHLYIEAACAAGGGAAMLVAPGIAGLAGTLLAALLLGLAWLDKDHFWLPDALTVPLGLAGVGFGLAGVGAPLFDRVIGLAGGFLALSLVAWAYRAVRKRDGLGGGDAKMFAALGAWLGWQPLPMVMAGAGLIGLGWVLLAAVRGRAIKADTRLPLGTLMALSGFACWLWTTWIAF